MIVLDREELACSAGFVNGEGSFICYKSGRCKSYQLSLQISQAGELGKLELERFRLSVCGLGVIYGPLISKNVNHTHYYRYQTTSFEHVIAVIGLLWFKLSRQKKNQVVEAIKLYGSDKTGSRYQGGYICSNGHNVNIVGLSDQGNGYFACKECRKKSDRKRYLKNNPNAKRYEYEV